MSRSPPCILIPWRNVIALNARVRQLWNVSRLDFTVANETNRVTSRELPVDFLPKRRRDALLIFSYSCRSVLILTNCRVIVSIYDIADISWNAGGNSLIKNKNSTSLSVITEFINIIM